MFLEELKEMQGRFPPNLKKVLNVIWDIDKSLVDQNHSIIEIKNNLTFIKLLSNNELCCPLSIYFSLDKSKGIFQVTIGHDGRVILYDFSGYDLPDDDPSELIEILKSPIEEKLTIVNNKIVKSKYHYLITLKGKKTKVPYVGYSRLIWFWQKRKIKETKYKPWVR